VPGQNAPISGIVDTFGLVPFGMADTLRRAHGKAVAAFGLGPSECPHQIIASGSHWRLRDYGAREAADSLLIVAAPIKRPYIWDLAPSVSALHYCLREGLHVYLLEWMPASTRTGNNGLDEYALAISEGIAKISGKTDDTKPVLMGHSLGGTLAAIFAAMAPEEVRRLVLLSAPLCFQPGTSSFRDALVSLLPSTPTLAEGPFPGSLLSQVSALASPGTFIWSRLMDCALSCSDRHAMEIHARVERWALDEVPLPGKLVHQIVDWLYRENRFCRGALTVRGKIVGPSTLSVPTLVVVNKADEVAPPVSVEPFVEAMPIKNARVMDYSGEIGVCLQHLGILLGRAARAQVWPEIISWLKS
jgi:polyhydroxyalkanoate synthase subunit PhaC